MKTNMPSKETSTSEVVVKEIYNVELGEFVEYVLSVDENNEIVAKSTKNDDFLKFPNVSEEQIDAMIEAHNVEAATQVKKQPLFGAQPKEVEETE